PCAELEIRAGVWRFSASRMRQTQQDGVRHATGQRNMVAVSLHPQTGELYVAQHGRDRLFQNWPALFNEATSAELPSEELHRIRAGDDFGWPYCFHDRFRGFKVLAPEYGGDGATPGRCADVTPALIGYPGHWGPNDILFYDGAQFPEQYRGGAFIAFHGSWNRAPLPQGGFNVVFQPFDEEGRPTSNWSIFADGFRAVGARPTGLAIGPDGALFISADTGRRIWRVQHNPQP
ncbi:MAG TPA: PQQ-dependent sugar dehydrogenase, partial [Longimicrobiales bacterium]|nr:PQQ-dependent sugar dehydrogenase [Longimicrobiales bacterium]